MRRGDPRVGIAALLAVAGAVFFALVAIARYPSLFRRGTEFRAVFNSVAGLNTGDEVRYGGLLVGAIDRLELDPIDPTHIVVHFRVRRSTPIRVDTRASITQVGLLGEPYLNLIPGRPESPALPEGGVIPAENNMTFQDALVRLANLADRADTILGSVERMAGMSPLERLDRTLARIEQLVETTSSSSERLLGRLDVASGRLDNVLVRTDRLITTVDTTLRQAGPGLNATQREALAALKETRMLVADIRDGVEAGGGMDQLMRNLSVASENLARLTQRLENDPGSLLQQRANPRKVAGPPIRE